MRCRRRSRWATTRSSSASCPTPATTRRCKAVRHTEKLAAAVRERVGDDVDIMVDFHGRPDSLDAAIAYINAIAPIKPLFCEEVIQPGDAAAMADIARRVDCPLATGERLFTPREFAEIAETRAVAYIQPDLAHCMGFTGGRKIAAIAEAAHMGVCPHNPMGPVAGAVALNFDVATTNFVIQEEAVGIVPWFEEICSVHPLQARRRLLGGAGRAGPRHRDRRGGRRQASVRSRKSSRRSESVLAGRPHRQLVEPRQPPSVVATGRPLAGVRPMVAVNGASAPGPVPGIFVVPLVGRLPDAGDARLQVLRRCTSSTTSSMPRPGLSGTVMKPSLTSGLGRPVTMSSHQSTSTEWYSSAMKFSVAIATCAAAIAAIGLSAMWMAMATPWSCAMSPIFLVSRMPPRGQQVGMDDRDAAP